jgi:hypothetical protein
MIILLLMANLRWSGREGALLVSITQWRMNIARNKGRDMLRASHSKKMTKMDGTVPRARGRSRQKKKAGTCVPASGRSGHKLKKWPGASPGQWFAGGTSVGSRRRRLKGERRAATGILFRQ